MVHLNYYITILRLVFIVFIDSSHCMRQRKIVSKGLVLELKTGHLKRRQKYIKNFISEKFRKFFFSCILPDYMAHKPPKEFGRNNCIFWKYDSWFPYEVSKLTSIRMKPNLLFIDSWKQKMSFEYVMVPKNLRRKLAFQNGCFFFKILWRVHLEHNQIKRR